MMMSPSELLRHEKSPYLQIQYIHDSLIKGEIDYQHAILYATELERLTPIVHSVVSTQDHEFIEEQKKKKGKLEAFIAKLNSEQMTSTIESINGENKLSGEKINVRGGLKELAVMLLRLEDEGLIDHVTDKQAAEHFTVRGAPVNPDSLKSIRSRDL
jgi:hypothetical protein